MWTCAYYPVTWANVYFNTRVKLVKKILVDRA
uniref:Uncharacterized protein n=1 Tax=Arundo donax TaxID=35708 RepID=A0A0A9C0Z4_ARUDO